MARQTVSSDTTWESRFGYSRAVQHNEHVHVSGTTATDETGTIVGEGDAAAQMRQALQNIEWALSEVDASLDDVIRTRMYVVDLDDADAVGEAHAEFFGDVRPATTLVGITGLADPRMLVEVEATAIVD